MDNETRRLVLLRAADLIEEFGWTRGSGGMPCMHYDGEREPLCLLGAIAQAAYDLGVAKQEPGFSLTQFEGDYYHEMGFAAIFVGDRCEVAYGWNDSSSRTSKQVTQRLRDTAAALAPVEAPAELVVA